MPWTPLQSSMLQGFDYDPALKALKVRFRAGQEAVYRDVPDDVAAGLETAESPGSYFHRHIKDRFAVAW